jgi:flagellin-like protein
MKKGVSPVVAVVLLIAIAVISAVAVWYWVSPLTARPAVAETTQKSIAVTACYYNANPANIDVRNTGGLSLSARFFEVRYSDNGSAVSYNSSHNAYANMSSALSSGDSKTISVYACSSSSCGSGSQAMNLSTSVSYFLRSSGMPDQPFTC